MSKNMLDYVRLKYKLNQMETKFKEYVIAAAELINDLKLEIEETKGLYKTENEKINDTKLHPFLVKP